MWNISFFLLVLFSLNPFFRTITINRDVIFFFFLARYLTHYASWGVLAAYSPEYGYPFGSVVSISDGLLKNSSGTPYLYLSDNGDTHHNLNHNNSAGLTLTMSESEICRRNGLDPLEPLCARMILLGKVRHCVNIGVFIFSKPIILL